MIELMNWLQNHTYDYGSNRLIKKGNQEHASVLYIYTSSCGVVSLLERLPGQMLRIWVE